MICSWLLSGNISGADGYLSSHSEEMAWNESEDLVTFEENGVGSSSWFWLFDT